jgi:hypothetical protein
MTDNFVNLHKWYERLQRTCADQEIVDEITRRMKAENDKEDARTLAFFLASEFCRQKRYVEAERILLNLSQRNPVEPFPLISLAEQKLYYEEKPNEALEIVEKALNRARACGYFHRNALGVKARIAETLQRYDLVGDVLREIMTIKFSESRADVGVERDFVDRLPAGAIGPILLRQYDEFCRSRAS